MNVGGVRRSKAQRLMDDTVTEFAGDYASDAIAVPITAASFRAAIRTEHVARRSPEAR